MKKYRLVQTIILGEFDTAIEADEHALSLNLPENEDCGYHIQTIDEEEEEEEEEG
jgi:hypothetical protein